MLEDESAANYADELGMADAVLEERRKEARRLAAEMLKKAGGQEQVAQVFEQGRARRR